MDIEAMFTLWSDLICVLLSKNIVLFAVQKWIKITFITKERLWCSKYEFSIKRVYLQFFVSQ
jgi:hypothetical protein